MTTEDLEFYSLDNGYPTNDDDDIGGSLDALWTDETDVLFNGVEVDAAGGSDNVYYAAAAVKVKTGATGTLESPELYNRAASNLNTNAGTATVQSSHPDDDGDVRLHGKNGGTWSIEDIAVAGTSPSGGAEVFDATSVCVGEYLVEGAAAKPIGDVSVSIGGETFMVIRGTGKPAATDVGNGEYMATALFDLALCTALNTELTWASDNDRTTAPNNVGSFARADFDNKLAAPDDMVAGDELHYCWKMTVKAGLTAPVLGYWIPDLGWQGSPA